MFWNDFVKLTIELYIVNLGGKIKLLNSDMSQSTISYAGSHIERAGSRDGNRLFNKLT